MIDARLPSGFEAGAPSARLARTDGAPGSDSIDQIHEKKANSRLSAEPDSLHNPASIEDTNLRCTHASSMTGDI